ncbi:hypothetical protein [Mangrovimonas sp. YM274]|uniref:hypothetical protein n=1 Tax=Mangrovimonas sp. YM274 TaxID=3070660 RepID=UPI0027DCD93E|nr:hypothetical protein [Mangrovimonas sp. YM274]WMI68993.1 hypothetical protein RBH95_01165 [Mangrovimonas sp. YM274]
MIGLLLISVVTLLFWIIAILKPNETQSKEKATKRDTKSTVGAGNASESTVVLSSEKTKEGGLVSAEEAEAQLAAIAIAARNVTPTVISPKTESTPKEEVSPKEKLGSKAVVTSGFENGRYRVFQEYVIDGKHYTYGFPKSNCPDKRVWVGLGKRELERISIKETKRRLKGRPIPVLVYYRNGFDRDFSLPDDTYDEVDDFEFDFDDYDDDFEFDFGYDDYDSDDVGGYDDFGGGDSYGGGYSDYGGGYTDSGGFDGVAD